MEFENILKLIDSVSASKLDSFVYEQNGTKIRLEKKKQKIQLNGTPDLAMESAAICAKEAVTDTDTGTQKSGKTITSPLVGVFYAAPSEDADPFVKVGDPVKKGQVVGIVEAMKLMNEITSDCDGVVREVCVENAEAVEYGQPLFVIEEA
ncbi:acetyl-CoA carboxylase biotin carboxyl carrier protein [Laedolimicola ammoniilytica]|uniref:Biotin carboxyl carrier protein of acetyl-CoA carboxylase n=1 Tax=Laedolimicola ammoniilytica TaxID=2981771 RepID=A0ABT2RXA7_9FIRM|nr:acetyl-CoA carboxylase biotin carboxyl carrier protein [Laedolimicola ammoniilytica]MCU6696949.1 acetyl-CoA carboxylase biotin carboxyl carrier protein [Laedolimicola ammoniilytica]SCI00326.1 Biotin carboxyl carrier protein of acetyl-CoA carboxylase [uncultured Clostridium sp.]